MSFPDYHQTADDHQSILVLVRQISPEDQLSAKSFNKIYDRIKRISEIKIQDAQGMGCERIIKLRFKKNDHDDANNEWGDFQAHRKVIGMITVAACAKDGDLTDIYSLHETSTQRYSSSLLDSRCFIFKSLYDTPPLSGKVPQAGEQAELKANGVIVSSEELSQSPLDVSTLAGNPSEADTSRNNSTSPPNENGEADNTIGHDEVPLDTASDLVEKSSDLAAKMKKVSNHSKQRAVQTIVYETKFTLGTDFSDSCLMSTEHSMESDIQNLVASLFWVLESKRLDRSFEKLDRVPCLVAPFEGRTLVGVDTNTSSFKKRCLGRMKKHIADLSLLAGHPSEALTLYGNAIVTLKAVNDWLWLAAAYEGQCVASLALLYPAVGRRKMSLQRNASLPPSKFKQLQDTANGKSGDSDPVPANGGKAGIRKKFAQRTLSERSGATLGSNLVQANGPDPIVLKALGKNLLATPNEIYDKYKEACCHYAKFKPAAVIEMECSFKAARALTFLEKFMGASEFIQNAVFISLTISNEEQINRLTVIASLYTEIGYHRKAAFYKRFAALKAVSLNLADPNWNQCYNLLIPALEGYHLTLDPLDYERRSQMTSKAIGWVGIHLQLLQELVTTARRMKLEQVAVRHLSFLLHSLFEFLTPTQREEFANQLMALSSKCGEGAPVPLTLDNGTVIPSVNFTKFPYVITFKVKRLAAHLAPFKLKNKLDKKDTFPSSPFIYTPLPINRPLNRRLSVATGQIQDFKWIENEPCEVTISVCNYLPTELSIGHINLMTDGVPFEIHPSALTIGAQSGPETVTLTGTPRGHGNLEILGYSTHVLGVKSNCQLKDLPLAKRNKFPSNYCIEIVSPLPLLSLACPDLHKSSVASPLTVITNSKDVDFVASTYNVTIFMGEKKTVTVALTNSSSNDELVDLASVTLISKMKKAEQERFISFNCDINEKLPLAPGSTADFPVDFFGIGEFVVEGSEHNSNLRPQSNASALTNSKSGTSSPTITSGFNSPSHSKKQTLQLGTALANFLSDLQSSSSSNVTAVKLAKEKRGDPLSGGGSGQESSQEFSSRIVEVVIEFEYSGGPGLASGFCRKSALRFIVEILPSALITHWDVLPAEIPSRCFLVIDILNASNIEMELNYSNNKSILIEAKETCRIPVPIERCPLTRNSSDDLLTSLGEKCKAHLAGQVHLEFVLVGSSESRGIASINKIDWSRAMLNTILMSPLQWKISFNHQVLSSEKPEFACKVGDYVTCAISISNASEYPLKSLCLWMQLYQDHQNGTRNYRLDMKRALSGSEKVFIDEISPQEVYNHECSFIFFYSGSFKMEIQCSGFDFGSAFGAEVYQEKNTNSATYFKQQQQLRAEMVSNKTNGNSRAPIVVSPSSDGPSLWKCTPSVEVVVSDS